MCDAFRRHRHEEPVKALPVEVGLPRVVPPDLEAMADMAAQAVAGGKSALRAGHGLQYRPPWSGRPAGSKDGRAGRVPSQVRQDPGDVFGVGERP